ncbi:MAG: sodium:solute symporter [Fimbriimonadaceae bacterium]|nr:sodium:solute symporter [Fimbriimonadaceae bacterium]
MLTTLDYAIILLYFVGVAWFGARSGGRQRGTGDYFLGGRNVPWWAVCFSIVATETSTLTVIGVPAIAFGGTLTFIQMTFGYILARIVVALWFLPRYATGQMETAYEFLGHRFGDGMRATASVVFMATRLLADGVRLFATAIPIKVIFDSVQMPLTYPAIILGIGIVTAIYTLIGGIKAVIWMDVVQMFVYVGGAVAALVVLLNHVPGDWLARAVEAGKTQWLDTGAGKPLGENLTQPYWIVCAVLGGAVFGMASHGTDHLIVQRLLTCRATKDAQKALVVSGLVVFLQFALFLAIGILLWAHYGFVDFKTLGLERGDEVFPKFIIEGLPPGVSGLILAGILAAAMSTLSSSLNALASSSMSDVYRRFSGKDLEPARALYVGRVLTVVWAFVFIGFACLFRDTKNAVVELGLSIASFTYGGLLGVFVLGLVNKRARQTEAIAVFLTTIAVMTVVIFGVWYGNAGWVFAFRPSEDAIKAQGLKAIGWPWYTVIGSALTVALGSLIGALRRR